jgi:hypothetical protein
LLLPSGLNALRGSPPAASRLMHASGALQARSAASCLHATSANTPLVPTCALTLCSGPLLPPFPSACPPPPLAQVVAVLSAALQEEVSSQLNRRKSRSSFGVNRKSPPSAPAAAPAGGLSTVSETGASGRRSFEDRPPKAAGAEQGSQQAQSQGADTVPATSQGCCVIA